MLLNAGSRSLRKCGFALRRRFGASIRCQSEVVMGKEVVESLAPPEGEREGAEKAEYGFLGSNGYPYAKLLLEEVPRASLHMVLDDYGDRKALEREFSAFGPSRVRFVDVADVDGYFGDGERLDGVFVDARGPLSGEEYREEGALSSEMSVVLNEWSEGRLRALFENVGGESLGEAVAAAIVRWRGPAGASRRVFLSRLEVRYVVDMAVEAVLATKTALPTERWRQLKRFAGVSTATLASKVRDARDTTGFEKNAEKSASQYNPKTTLNQRVWRDWLGAKHTTWRSERDRLRAMKLLQQRPIHSSVVRRCFYALYQATEGYAIHRTNTTLVMCRALKSDAVLSILSTYPHDINTITNALILPQTNTLNHPQTGLEPITPDNGLRPIRTGRRNAPEESVLRLDAFVAVNLQRHALPPPKPFLPPSVLIQSKKPAKKPIKNTPKQHQYDDDMETFYVSKE